MLPGLLVGGLIGSLFFRGGGGGLGMFDLLLLGVAVFLVVRWVRGPQPAFEEVGTAAAAPGLIGDAPVAAPFDEAAFVAAAKQLFSSLQTALALRDVSLLCDRLTPQMYEGLSARCAELKAARQHSRIERVEFQRVEVTGAWRDRDQEWTRVCLQGSMDESTVDDVTAKVVDSAPTAFEEYWTFQRLLGSARWKLCGIQAVETERLVVPVS
jgi:predicted lipid-binding transport protein (Tim44 family)